MIWPSTGRDSLGLRHRLAQPTLARRLARTLKQRHRLARDLLQRRLTRPRDLFSRALDLLVLLLRVPLPGLTRNLSYLHLLTLFLSHN